MPERITSFQNSKIKLVRKLRDKRQRDRAGLFVVDTARDLQRALAAGYAVDFALHVPERSDAETTALAHHLPPSALYIVSDDILQKASYRQNPGGLVAVLHQKVALSAADAAESDVQHLLILVDLRKPGNIGALLRTADATGFGAVWLVDTALDLYNPNIIRSSTGACFLNNVYYLTGSEAQTLLQSGGYHTVAGLLGGDRTLFDVDFRRKTAVILGTEDTGLDATWANHCDTRVHIPMVGHLTDSLNVSVSGAVFMYEALRQRLQAASDNP